MAPRSSATTLRPASASSFDRMPPVQPRPTMTTSTSFSFVAMVPSRSTDVRDPDGIVGERLVAILLDMLAVNRDRAREAEHLPARLVAIAAVDRVGEHALHHGLVDRVPEGARRQAVIEGEFAGRERDEDRLALRLVEPVEGLGVSLDAMRVGRRDAGAVELRGRERQLIALVRH